MDPYPALRVVKVLAVAALFAGSIGAVLARDLADRRRFAYWLAGPGFGLAWATGFGLVAVTAVSLLSWWILGALVLSFFSLQVVLFAVGREGRRGPVTASLILLPLVATVVLMVYRPG
jgi:hypothetical protein